VQNKKRLIAEQQKQIEALTEGLQKVGAHLEVNKPGPQTVLNHAEHHFRPKLHWTKMKQLHEEIAEAQRREGVRVITPPHALGFLDPNLPWSKGKESARFRLAKSD
jgi:hypothetical protein